MIRILIAAASPIMRAGLQALANSNPEWHLVGSFPDLSSLEDLHPDVILAALPREHLGPAMSIHALPLIVLLTDEPQPSWTLEALHLGVRAVLPHDATQAAITAAIEAAASGLAVIEPDALETLLSASTPVPPSGEAAALTEREIEILRLIADGAANKNIAWKLGISEHTVKFHVASILSKLGASSRTEAVTIGIRRGILFL